MIDPANAAHRPASGVEAAVPKCPSVCRAVRPATSGRWAGRWLAPSLVAAALAGCDVGHDMMMGGQAFPARFQSNGERIYFTATSESGDRIEYTGGSFHVGMMGMAMAGGGCASCHGAAREGGRLMPEFWKVAPPLTHDALFEGHGDDDGHGAHEHYTEETLRRAVSRGIDPAGAPLDEAMPRWSLSERDWRDLLAYLRT